MATLMIDKNSVRTIKDFKTLLHNFLIENGYEFTELNLERYFQYKEKMVYEIRRSDLDTAGVYHLLMGYAKDGYTINKLVLSNELSPEIPVNEDKKEIWRKSIGEGNKKGLIEVVLNVRTENVCSPENSFKLEFYNVHRITGYIIKQNYKVVFLQTECTQDFQIDLITEIFERRTTEYLSSVEIFNPLKSRLTKRGYENGLMPSG